MAQIVVPWGSTKPGFPAEGSSFGVNGWWPRRRSRSTKFGPGSSPGVNRGRVMWRRRLSPGDELHDPTSPEGEVVRLIRVVHRHVRQRLGEQRRVLFELAEPVVAPHAQQATDFAGRVVVVDVERFALLGKVATDGAYSMLVREQFIILFERQPELSL